MEAPPVVEIITITAVEEAGFISITSNAVDADGPVHSGITIAAAEQNCIFVAQLLTGHSSSIQGEIVITNATPQSVVVYLQSAVGLRVPIH